MNSLTGFQAPFQTSLEHYLLQFATSRRGASAKRAHGESRPGVPSGDREPRPPRHKPVARRGTSYVRAMEPFEVIKSAFKLYRQHFGTFFALAAPGVLLVILASAVQIFGMLRLSKIFPGSSPGMIAATNGASLLFSLLLWFSIFLVTAAATLAVSHAVLHRPVSVVGAYRGAVSGPVLGRVLVGSAIAVLASFSTTLLGQGLGALIPGGDLLGLTVLYWLFVRFLLFPQVVVMEKARVWEGFRRSWRLTANHTLRVVLTWLMYLVLALLCLIGILLPWFVVAAFSEWEGANAPVALSISVVGLLCAPIALLVNVLLYYSLRCDTEEYDECQLARDL